MSHWTKLGRFQVAEPLSALASLHSHDGTTLKEVDHEPKADVLDQEDLLAQGIQCSKFIDGAGDPGALGSCTANANTAHMSNVMDESDFTTFVSKLGKTVPKGSVYQDTKAMECAAIGFYHAETNLTGTPSEEWPPTDCGSSGPYMFQMSKQLGLIKSQKIASHPQGLISLLQTEGVLMGTPWLQAWFEPSNLGFIDGNGSSSVLEKQIKQGVAGGHEILISAIPKLVFLHDNIVDTRKTVLRVRNSWTRSWGDNGSYYVHLSTLDALASHCDFRQFAV